LKASGGGGGGGRSSSVLVVMGHIFGMAFIGLLFIIFKDLIPLEQISNYSEQLVGLVLVGIGLWAFFKVFNGKKNHLHSHVRTGVEAVIERQAEVNKKSYFTSFYIGVLHGFAGVAHYFLFLPVLGFKTLWDSTAYVIGSCIGIIMAMTAFAIVLGKVASLSKNESNPMFFKGLRLAAGLLAIIIGIYWMLFS
jgi:hypothetical protein